MRVESSEGPLVEVTSEWVTCVPWGSVPHRRCDERTPQGWGPVRGAGSPRKPLGAPGRAGQGPVGEPGPAMKGPQGRGQHLSVLPGATGNRDQVYV